MISQSPSEFSPVQPAFSPNVVASSALSTAEGVSTRRPSHIAFVDAGLADVDTLIAGLENTQVVLIDAGGNGIAQITTTLSSYENLTSVQIFSHGSDGLLQLGETLLSSANVDSYGTSLQQWSRALAAEADLMIYGCNVAAGADGLSLVHRLGELTGADVAASNDLTGAGGNWQLEVETGTIESAVALAASAQALYEGELALLTNGDFEQGLSGWQTLRGSGSITTDAISGSSALEIGGTSRGVKQTLSATGGQTYTLTGSGKTSSGGNTSIGLTFYDASGSRLAARARKVRSRDWGEFTIEREAPAGTQSVRIWAYKANDTGSFFLDNLALNSGTVDPVEPPAAGSELLSNAGFESGLNRWKKVKGTETTVGGAFAGSKALRLSTAGSGARQVLSAVGGETYKLSGYGKKSSDGYVGFGITFYDGNSQKINNSGVGRSVRSADWQLYEGEAVAPENARFVRFWTYKANGNGDGLLDQLSLKTDSGSPSPPPELGRIGLDDSTIGASEGDGSVTVTVNRTGSTAGVATVDYSTVVGSATAGSDYQARSGTLTFADGETQQSVNILLLNDNTPEEQEVFGFAIDNVNGTATLGAPRTAQISIADNDGFTYRGNQYVLTSSAKNWTQAQAEAASLGGNLVTINTAAEETWLKQTFGDEGYWIGLNDIDTEGMFEWASGESVGYTNWAPGEPNNGGGNQDYGWMNYGPALQWDDDSPGVTRLGVVEIGEYNGPADGQGNGLKGEYYNNTDFTDLAVTRTDATVNFNWGEGSPAANIDRDTFSVRWSGQIEARYSENYTFQTTSDDGVRLWVNERLIIDEYREQPATAFTGTIALNAGQKYDIRMEYFENGGA
ncbi:MAG: DUF4347 domain-containing protein, partial [Cyanobacteria bacterium J06560_2]